MDPKNLLIEDFDYHLPEELIASYPLPHRTDSRLLIYRDGIIQEDIYEHLAEYLPSGSLLVFNDSRVIEARLLFQKSSGGIIEIFCLEPENPRETGSTALNKIGSARWHCLVGGASKWKRGQVLEKSITGSDASILLQASIIGKASDHFTIEFTWEPATFSFQEILHELGAIPLPPYIKRAAEEMDKLRYQTVYAHSAGSVAAPTAGLHFTPALFEKLERKNIATDFVTLHVGTGTFQPVKADNLAAHEMHAESLEMSRSTLEHIMHHLNSPILAVGTTSLRTLESVFGIALKILNDPGLTPDKLHLNQWEIYQLAERKVSVEEALGGLMRYMEQHNMETLRASTQLLIAPGYRPMLTNGLITNFHQPRSTLLVLVAALLGEDWKKVYQYALGKKFRFLSYGDGCLLWYPER